MQKFTKKPVTIEARQFTNNNSNDQMDEIVAWIKESGGDASHNGTVIHIRTLEGTLYADRLDWIIRGIKGEFYPCKPDIFEATYVPGIREGMPFGAAIEALKNGERVTRAGWNGKGMYLWLLPEAKVPADWCKEPHLRALAEANPDGSKTMHCLPSIRMKTADGKVLTGWLASQTDIFANDWMVVG
jgi:hypothetical protein